MTRPRQVVSAIVLAVLAVALLTSPAANLAVAQTTGADVSADRIIRHIQFLASDKLQGRRAGTPSADEAARYIAEQFRSYGLKPVAASGLLQPFSFVAGVKLGESNSFEIKSPGGSRSFKVGSDFMPLAFSSSDAVSGEIVFAGYGISAAELQYDSYAGIDPKGKVVMILRGSPDGDNPHGRFAEYTQPGLEIQNKTLKAREKGALGVIFVSEEKEFSKDRLSRLRHDLNFLDSGIPTITVSRAVANSILTLQNPAQSTDKGDQVELAKIHEKTFAIPGAAASFKADVVKVSGNGANVVGMIQGSDPQLAREYVVIGAHYDHLGLGGPESLAANPEGQIHHGADDNASGTSGLLELARVFAQSRPTTKRSIVFIAFSGEELGLLGSSAYTKNPPMPLGSAVAMLNMDMIGRLRNQSLFVGGVGTSPAWKPLLEGFNAANAPAGSESGAPNRFTLSYGEDGFGPSDHQSFYIRDIPVLFFFTGAHDDYHKPTDTADKINAAGASQVATMVGKIAAAVANEPQRIAFIKVKSETKPTGRGFRVYLGTVPNYSDQSDGMKLDGVRPASPAERAGLMAGDIITRIGKTAIKNVYDYTYALGEMRAGEEVEVSIRRNGHDMTLKITPEKRQ